MTALNALEDALNYSLDGWYPTPIRPQSKRAFLDDWPTRPRLMVEEVAYHWGNNPDYNVGLVCGYIYDVLDIDGAEGRDNLSAYLGARRYRHRGPAVLTGGGGLHLYFKATGFGSPTGILKKVDWRGVGGQVVAPPSIHPATGRPYEWVPGQGPETPLPDADPWLIDLLTPPAPTTTPSPRVRDGPRGSVTGVLASRGVPFRSTAGRYVFRCPTGLHSDSDWSAKTHATDNPDGWWKCFGCGATGDATNLQDGSYVLNRTRHRRTPESLQVT